MEGGDAWRMLRCAGGVQDNTIINRIMLRFRPIAPKPANGDSVSGDSTFGNKNTGVTSKRVKRKYVRVCKRNNTRRIALDEAKKDNAGNKGSPSLHLLPESADLDKSTVGGDIDLSRTAGDNYPIQDPPSPCLKLKKMVAAVGPSDQTALIASRGRTRRVTVLESRVTVENVTDTCMDGGEIGNFTDVERMKNLEHDTCPSFVSDGWNHVLWVNEAYKKMVGGGTAVGVVVKEGLEFPRGSFSCRVGLQYVDGKGKKKQWRMVPCDVWKMSSGGFAWRLDLKAALTLGL
ncbi:Detected protein of unknown function [Hibiscus syriacus]|uniref:DUF7950 domain-containing protein n=1 Tax=Hibiscus syriacus TaxID=106335 RepID=A0A6A2YEA3_HIBSY|nr:uncharacterized protein LOC120172068 [Hibiscus syriacus]KAE8672457.1 Detected protein of unknown function [Hibiscus syriacus]